MFLFFVFFYCFCGFLRVCAYPSRARCGELLGFATPTFTQLTSPGTQSFSKGLHEEIIICGCANIVGTLLRGSPHSKDYSSLGSILQYAAREALVAPVRSLARINKRFIQGSYDVMQGLHWDIYESENPRVREACGALG